MHWPCVASTGPQCSSSSCRTPLLTATRSEAAGTAAKRNTATSAVTCSTRTGALSAGNSNSTRFGTAMPKALAKYGITAAASSASDWTSVTGTSSWMGEASVSSRATSGLDLSASRSHHSPSERASRRTRNRPRIRQYRPKQRLQLGSRLRVVHHQQYRARRYSPRRLNRIALLRSWPPTSTRSLLPAIRRSPSAQAESCPRRPPPPPLAPIALGLTWTIYAAFRIHFHVR